MDSYNVPKNYNPQKGFSKEEEALLEIVQDQISVFRDKISFFRIIIRFINGDPSLSLAVQEAIIRNYPELENLKNLTGNDLIERKISMTLQIERIILELEQAVFDIKENWRNPNNSK